MYTGMCTVLLGQLVQLVKPAALAALHDTPLLIGVVYYPWAREEWIDRRRGVAKSLFKIESDETFPNNCTLSRRNRLRPLSVG